MKVKTNLTIEHDLWINAKEKIDNASQFVEKKLIEELERLEKIKKKEKKNGNNTKVNQLR